MRWFTGYSHVRHGTARAPYSHLILPIASIPHLIGLHGPGAFQPYVWICILFRAHVCTTRDAFQPTPGSAYCVELISTLTISASTVTKFDRCTSFAPDHSAHSKTHSLSLPMARVQLSDMFALDCTM